MNGKLFNSIQRFEKLLKTMKNIIYIAPNYVIIDKDTWKEINLKGLEERLIIEQKEHE